MSSVTKQASQIARLKPSTVFVPGAQDQFLGHPEHLLSLHLRAPRDERHRGRRNNDGARIERRVEGKIVIETAVAGREALNQSFGLAKILENPALIQLGNHVPEVHRELAELAVLPIHDEDGYHTIMFPFCCGGRQSGRRIL